MSNSFGWDLVFKTVQSDITGKHDILIAFVHWNLIKNGFTCLGKGDEKSLKSDDIQSELLPDGWNKGPSYALRYLWKDNVYIFHAIVADGNIIFNLLKGSDLSVSNVAMSIEDTVNEMSGPISQVIPEHNEVIQRIKVELIEPVTIKVSTTAETQTVSAPASEPWTSYDDPLSRPSFSSPNTNPRSLNERFGNIGSSDLNPLGVGGGGMIFDPFGQHLPPRNPGFGIPGGLPSVAVPPGARFDPFSPYPQGGGFNPLPHGPGRPRRPPPDADHLPPPGFDDMFM